MHKLYEKKLIYIIDEVKQQKYDDDEMHLSSYKLYLRFSLRILKYTCECKWTVRDICE